MNSYKILFLEAWNGGGHISITTSIIQAIEKNYPDIETMRVDVVPPLAHKFYQLASRQFVNTYQLLYKATDNQHGEFLASGLNSVINRKKLARAIIDNKPDLVFSNYSLAIGEIPRILERHNLSIPFVVFVPDPFTVHSIYLSKKADMTFVSTLAAYQTAVHKGIPASQVEITGHPVREEFIGNQTVRAYKKKLGLDPDVFTILFGGSGHGAEKTLEILFHLGAKPSGALLKHLLSSANLDYKTYYKLFFKKYKRQTRIAQNLQAICICGDNSDLKEDLEMLKFPVNIKPLIVYKISDIAQYVHASDLIAGKAGPNILFESAMANKPFLATYHIKGQEDGNLDFIRSAQLGFVEENPQITAQLIETILENKKLLDYTKPGIEYVRATHEKAAEKIAGRLVGLINSKR